jgi:hypothetical protein
MQWQYFKKKPSKKAVSNHLEMLYETNPNLKKLVERFDLSETTNKKTEKMSTTKKTFSKKTETKQKVEVIDNSTYPKGLMIFPPHQNAKDFVKGNVLINIDKLNQWIEENADKVLHDTEHGATVKIDLLEGDKGLYFKTNTYKKEG